MCLGRGWCGGVMEVYKLYANVRYGTGMSGQKLYESGGGVYNVGGV